MRSNLLLLEFICDRFFRCMDGRTPSDVLVVSSVSVSELDIVVRSTDRTIRQGEMKTPEYCFILPIDMFGVSDLRSTSDAVMESLRRLLR